MSETKKPSILTGAIVGLLLTAPAAALFFLASQLVGVSFVPFDVFDYTARIQFLAPVITLVIETMVSVIRGLNLGETSSTAKTFEHIFAMIGFFITGMAAGAVLFYILNRRKDYHPSTSAGVILGAVVGVPIILMSYSINQYAFEADPTLGMISAMWALFVFLGWGIAINWVYNRLYITTAEEISTTPTASATAIDRRQFLVRVGGATATLTVIGAGLGALLTRTTSSVVASAIPDANAPLLTDGQGIPLPNANASLIPVKGTRPEYTPLDQHYRIDISSRPPVIDGETWRLEIDGLVDNPVKLALDEIREMDSMEQYITLACISNPLGGDLTSTIRWTGVSFQQFIDLVKPQANATHVRMTSADGFDEVMDLSVAREDERVMLAYAWDGVPLQEEHGFPLRVYIPDRFGMKQPKWMTKIEFIDAWEPGYWVRRTWNAEAMMVATSVIDTIATDELIPSGDGYLLPIGGMAHAGSRGVSKVQIKVNDEEWADAELREPMSETTWILWRFEWPFVEGQHIFRVRCVDGDGTEQIETVRGTHPDGATGIHSRTRNVSLPA